MPGFLAREDLLPVKLPLRRSPLEVAALSEETAFSRLSLEAKTNSTLKRTRRNRENL